MDRREDLVASGLRDAHNLAWKLDEALQMVDPEDLLDSYEAERKPHAWSMIELALRMGKIMMPASVPQGKLIRMGFRLLGLYGPARDYFVQMRYKPKPRFSAGLIRPTPNIPGAAAIGRMIPQPLVTAVDRRQVLLDTLLPDRPVMLVFSEAPERWLDTEMLERLQKLGCAVIGLTPEWTNPASAPFPVVRDSSRFFSQKPFRDCLDTALLLRRDRYVAALEPVQSIAGLVPMIIRLTEPPENRRKPFFTEDEELRSTAV